MKNRAWWYAHMQGYLVALDRELAPTYGGRGGDRKWKDEEKCIGKAG